MNSTEVYKLTLFCHNVIKASSHDAIAVIGIVTVFQGLVAVCVSQNGPTLYRPSLLEKSTTIDESSLGHRKSLVVSYWMSDTISSKNGCRIAWNIACNDGKVYCWSVPCTNKDSSHFYLSSAERKVRWNLTISRIYLNLYLSLLIYYCL